MTDKEKLEKINKLADAMYHEAQYLTTDASRLHKAMDKYHNFIIHECKEEPVKIKKGCKYRCLSDMVNRDTGNISFIGDKIYLAPEDDTLVSEENGWLCDISENSSNFELVEEPISNSIDFEQELYKAFGQVKDFTLGMQIAKWFYDMGRNHQEPVSEDLHTAAKEYANSITEKTGYRVQLRRAVVYGAKWQKKKMMSKAIDGDITFDYYGDDDKTYGCIAHNSFCLEDFGLKDRDKVKVIIIKED